MTATRAYLHVHIYTHVVNAHTQFYLNIFTQTKKQLEIIPLRTRHVLPTQQTRAILYFLFCFFALTINGTKQNETEQTKYLCNINLTDGL